jgi:hypothetical protein
VTKTETAGVSVIGRLKILFSSPLRLNQCPLSAAVHHHADPTLSHTHFSAQTRCQDNKAVIKSKGFSIPFHHYTTSVHASHPLHPCRVVKYWSIQAIRLGKALDWQRRKQGSTLY